VSLVHSSLTIFVILNGARVIAYWPQIVRVYRDPGCATAVSPWTWIVFTGANIATVIYALAELGDVIMAAVFGANTIGCGAIATLTTYKRCRHRHPFWKSGFLESPPKLDGHFDRGVTAPGDVQHPGCARGLQSISVAHLSAGGSLGIGGNRLTSCRRSIARSVKSEMRARR
jgi:hypothetical protein